MWWTNNIQHPLGVIPPTNLDRIVSTIGLTSVTVGDVLVLDTTAASNLSFDANSANSIFGRVMQATALEAPAGICCVALEGYTGSAMTQIRARFAGIVTAKCHFTTAGSGGAVLLRGQSLIVSAGGGTPGRSFTRIAAPAVASARKARLLETNSLTDGTSGLLRVLLNGFAD